MAFEQRDMGGVLFKNEKKQEGDRLPDYTGNCLIGGKKWEIGAWIKPTQSGGKLMSLKFSETYKKDEGPKPPPIPKSADAPRTDDDDVPF